MKIQIVNEDEQPIQGYRGVHVKDGKIDFGNVSNNECTVIMANDILNRFSYSQMGECIDVLLSKLRLGGRLVIGGTDYRLFCTNVLSSMISEEDASNIVSQHVSMQDNKRVQLGIISAGLTPITTQIGGIHYEITAERR